MRDDYANIFQSPKMIKASFDLSLLSHAGHIYIWLGHSIAAAMGMLLSGVTVSSLMERVWPPSNGVVGSGPGGKLVGRGASTRQKKYQVLVAGRWIMTQVDTGR